MKKILLAPVLLFISSFSFAQLSSGGQPLNWDDKHIPTDIPFVGTDNPDYDRLNLEDAITDQHKDVPYRFGVEYEVSYGLDNSGNWKIDEENDLAIWQLGIECQGALAICLRFDAFRIPKGGNVYIWSGDREEFIGAFNHNNNDASGILATSLVHGDKVIVEYSLPLNAVDRGSLIVGQIVHGYRSFLNSKWVQSQLAEQRGPFGSSGACEVNINCPSGVNWQVEKRSVAIITEGGSGMCTGALVNNTANNGIPYFLTANHCTSGAALGNWVFYFNHETASCTSTIAPTNQSISGSTLKANNAYSDFALLQLNSTPPASFNAHYAGWDATDNEAMVSSAACIHHPSGDVKKISLENNAPYHSTGNGAQVWWIDNWETGVTEPGSSGSPLFNQNHRIIGQLYGGASACNGSNGNGQYDFYGRFGKSWNQGSTQATRLKEWLDPGNTGVLVLDGYPDGFTPSVNDAAASAINNVPATVCGASITPTFTLTNAGSTTLVSCTIMYQLNSTAAQTINWTGSLAQGATATVNLPTMTASSGSNTLTIWVTNPNGTTDENSFNNQVVATFNAFTGITYTATLTLNFDDFPEETSWEITQNGNVIYSGGTYPSQTDGSTLNLPICLSAGCYVLKMLDSEGDGMCCGFGQGSYQLTNQFGTVLASGDNFIYQQNSTFCMSATAVNENGKNIPVVYPNPSNDMLNIASEDIITTMEILDISGRVINISHPNTRQFSVSTSHLAEGIYHIRVITGETTHTGKVIVRH